MLVSLIPKNAKINQIDWSNSCWSLKRKYDREGSGVNFNQMHRLGAATRQIMEKLGKKIHKFKRHTGIPGFLMEVLDARLWALGTGHYLWLF